MNTNNNAHVKSQVESRLAIRHGVVGGFIAGIFFLLGEFFISVVMGNELLEPLRYIGSMVLGTQALQETYPLLVAAGVGFVIHMLLSMLYGVIFFIVLTPLRQLNDSAPGFLLYGMIYGLSLWILNFLLIAPVLFPQLTDLNPFWNLFFVHTFLYGLAVGAYAAIFNSRRVEARSAIPVTGKGGKR